MFVNVKTAVNIDAKEVLQNIAPDEVAGLLCLVAEKFDDDFIKRAKFANAFADSISEIGCRFLAEVVAAHYMRNP